MRRIASITGASALGLLLALAVWFRVSSLAAMPEPNGDESWYGTQMAELASGRSFSAFTPTGNPLSPFHSAMLAALIRCFGPQFWVLRAPAALCGVLTIGLTYLLVARAFDRPTALIASTLVAVLPVTVLFSRLGAESNQTPLFGLLALYFAWQTRGVALIVTFAASYLVHPTNVFLAPVLLVVYIARVLLDPAREPARRRRLVGAALVVAVAAVAIVGRIAPQRPSPRALADVLSPREAGRFWLDYGRLLCCLSISPVIPPESTQRLHDVAFGATFLGALLIGGTQLIRRRCWDRLALVAGLGLGLVGFYAVAGPGMIGPNRQRYGLVLVMPTVLALACLVRATLVEPGRRLAECVRGLQWAGLLVVAGALLWSVKANWFDPFTWHRQESLWTFRVDTPAPSERALARILADSAGRGEVIAQDWWTYRPLQYLALGRRGIRVASFEEMGAAPDPRSLLLDRMRAGAYVVSFPGQEVDTLAGSSFPPERLRRWDVLLSGARYLTIARLARPGERDAPAVANRPGIPGRPRR